MVTNKDVRDAVKLLVMQYEEGHHQAGYSNCPLCRLFGANSSDLSIDTCVNCPNYTFHIDNVGHHPCVTRTDVYPALDWGSYCSDYDDDEVFKQMSENADTLIKFWKRVLTLLPQGYKKEFILTQQQKESILSIAKQLQDEWDKEHNFDH